jgi:hypothetical protein
MGFYDARCMVTGVSLKGSQAALVLLQQVEEAYHPIALAITGKYDRLGSIDMIDEDENTSLILRYFQNQLAANTFVVDVESLRIQEAYPIETIEQLLRGFERNMNDGPGYAVLNGEPVVFSLIAATVWETIANSAEQSKLDDRAVLSGLFNEMPVTNEIYADHLDDVSGHLRAFAGVSAFLATRGVAWAPPDDWSQHYSDEMREYLEQARATFRDSQVITQALKCYENEIADLLED